MLKVKNHHIPDFSSRSDLVKGEVKEVKDYNSCFFFLIYS